MCNFSSFIFLFFPELPSVDFVFGTSPFCLQQLLKKYNNSSLKAKKETKRKELTKYSQLIVAENFPYMIDFPNAINYGRSKVELTN